MKLKRTEIEKKDKEVIEAAASKIFALVTEELKAAYPSGKCNLSIPIEIYTTVFKSAVSGTVCSYEALFPDYVEEIRDNLAEDFIGLFNELAAKNKLKAVAMKAS